MSLLTFFYKNGLWLSWPVFAIGALLLWFFVLTVVKLGDKNHICSLPLKVEQRIEFKETGQVVLWLKGPQLTPRFAGLTFELTGSEGSTSKGRRPLMRQRTSGLTQVRMADRVFTIPAAGRYVLHIRGLGEPKLGDEKHELIFMRSYLPQTIGCILGILLAAALVIGSIVTFFIRLSQGGGS